MEITTDSYRLDRMERGTEEIQRELRRRFNHVENCFQHFEDRRIALGRTAFRGSLLTIGVALLGLVFYAPARFARRSGE
jgi:hypothetical protein